MSTVKLSEAFVPHTAVEKLVHAGDVEGLTDYLAGLSEAQRVAERAGVRKLYKVMNEILLWTKPAAAAWRGPIKDGQKQALHVAVYVCGAPEDMVQDWFAFFHHRWALINLWRRIPRPDMQAYADLAIGRHSNCFPVLYMLAKTGMIEHPAHENYVLGLLTLSVDPPAPREPNPNFPRLEKAEPVLSIRGLLESDPEFMRSMLLRLFEVEGNSDLSLSNCDKYGKGLGSARHTMLGLFLDLLQQGVYSRALLLDKTLSALERDWLQYRSGWFSRLHDAMEPDAEEMRMHRSRYLDLCHSRNPPTVTLALAALEALGKHDVFSVEELGVALAPVMASKVKAQIVVALKLLDAVVKAEPAAATDAARLAVNALICDASDVQKQVLQRLQRWSVQGEAAALLQQFLPLLAATHRDAAKALLVGHVDEAGLGTPKVVANDHAALPRMRAPMSPLDASRVVAPIVTIDQLVDCVAYAQEHETDVEAFERTVEALVRMEAEAGAHAGRFGPALKRAKKLLSGKHLPRELSRLLIALLGGEKIAPSRSFEKGHFAADAFLCRRIDELVEFAGRHTGLPPLAAPTHRLGYIDPAVLIERVAAEQEKGVSSPRQEQALSLLRLAPGRYDTLLAEARKLAPEPYVLALRYALGDDVDVGREARLFCAAARIRHPGADDRLLIERYGDCGPDTCHHAKYQFHVTVDKHESWTFYRGLVDATPPAEVSDPDFLAALRHLPSSESPNPWYIYAHFGAGEEGLILMGASILPSDSEAHFAEGVRRLANNLDWSAAEWQNRAYLTLLLDPAVALNEMACLCLACGLAGKEPGQAALAVDALLAAWLEGRLRPDALSTLLRDGLAVGIFKAARLQKSLQNAARLHGLAPHLVFDVLCGALCLGPEDLPKDTAALLDLLLEVKLLSGRSLPESTRGHIVAMRLSGKGKAAQKSLI